MTETEETVQLLVDQPGSDLESIVHDDRAAIRYAFGKTDAQIDLACEVNEMDVHELRQKMESDAKADKAREDETGKPVRILDIISAKDLQQKKLKPKKFLVADILPEGLTLLAAPPKLGKSWLVLDLGLSIASGRSFMGKHTNRCGVLYLSLEDSEYRLQSRTNKVLNGEPAPETFYTRIEAPNLDNGLIDCLKSTIQCNPDIRLIIIDTLQMVRGTALKRESVYQYDVREIKQFKTFAEDQGLSIIFVHHTRKMRDDSDPFNDVSGTNGLTGTVDTTWRLSKEKRNSAEATLSITGRDVQMSDTVISFNQDSCRWEVVGDLDIVDARKEKERYDHDLIAQTIRKLLKKSPDHTWKGSSSDLKQAVIDVMHKDIKDSPQSIGRHISQLSISLYDYDGICHDGIKNGSGARQHQFYYAEIEDCTVDDR